MERGSEGREGAVWKQIGGQGEEEEEGGGVAKEVGGEREGAYGEVYRKKKWKVGKRNISGRNVEGKGKKETPDTP